MTLRTLFLAWAVLLTSAHVSAASVRIELSAAPQNPASPTMGDRLSFHTVIHNDGSEPVDGLIAWLSLVRIDRGKEQPVDLEDWSANRALAAASLAPGKTVESDWPIRLIQVGTYRVVVSAVSRSGANLTASPFADFTVRQKPVVESQRVLPVAIGIPLLLGATMLWRVRTTQAAHTGRTFWIFKRPGHVAR